MGFRACQLIEHVLLMFIFSIVQLDGAFHFSSLIRIMKRIVV